MLIANLNKHSADKKYFISGISIQFVIYENIPYICTGSFDTQHPPAEVSGYSSTFNIFTHVSTTSTH